MDEQPLSFAQCAGLTAASQLVMLPAGLAFLDVRAESAMAALGTAVAMLGPVAVAGWMLRRWNVPAGAAFSGFGAAIPLTPWIAAGVVGHLLLLSGMTHGLSAIWPWFARAAAEIELPVSGPPWAVALLLIVGAPVTEELLFRGVLLRGMLARYSVYASLAGTALLFAASHWYPAKILLMIPAGLALGWLYVRYRSVWPSLLAHALNNSAGAWLLLGMEQPPGPLPTLGWWQGGTMASAGVVLMWASYQCLRIPPDK